VACASISQLERAVADAGLDSSSIWATPEAWGDFGALLDQWIEQAASALAYAIVSAASVIEFEAIVIDGEMPAAVRDRLTARTAQIFATLDRRGLSEVEIVPGVIGPDAGALGGASLPLIRNFGRDREVLLKDTPARAN
jgi:predicted NBD/HSP70 family sugar kinase